LDWTRLCLIRHSVKTGIQTHDPLDTVFQRYDGHSPSLDSRVRGNEVRATKLFVLDFAARWRGRIGRPVTIASDQ
jgi:hypothetical protein